MNEPDSRLAEQALVAVRVSLAALRASNARKGGVAWESGKDIKLDADLLVNRELCSCLSRATGIRSISEEEIGTHHLPNGETAWIVDPLDGSMNFSRGIPLYCLSLALWRDGEPVIGIIYDMERDRTFCAHGGQAWVDDREIRVSAVEGISRAVLATGFPLHSDVSTEAVRWFLDFAKRFKKVRMLGTAALSLAWVAEGRLDAYFERDIMLWDVAAGAALVRGAGGLCMLLPGRHPMSLDVLAANPQLADEMKKFLGW